MLAFILLAREAAGQALLSGTVVSTESRDNLPGATVIAVQRIAAGRQPQFILATTDAQGQFQLALNSGATYSLCVRAEGYLDPCRWSTPTTAVGGVPTTPIKLAVERGISLRLLLDDPKALLGALGDVSGSRGGSLGSVSVQHSGSGKAHTIAAAAFGASSYVFEEVIPTDPAWVATFRSGRLDLLDDKGNSYSLGAPLQGLEPGFGLGGSELISPLARANPSARRVRRVVLSVKAVH